MGFLGGPLGWVMHQIYLLVNNFGMSIILFTIFIKVITLPLSIKQQKTTAMSARIQPQIKALQKKYGKNKVKLQEEMTKLQEQEGVNPAAGCLPSLVTMVVLFGIIDVIYNPLKHILRIPKETITAAGKVFGKATAGYQLKIISAIQGGANDYNEVFGADIINQIKEFDMTFLGLDLGAIPKLAFTLMVLIPILSGVTSFLTSYFSMRQQSEYGVEAVGMMKTMVYIAPLMSLWFSFTLPAGVGVYWIISNIVIIVQTLILGKIYTPERIADISKDDIEKNKEKMRKRREKLEAYNEKLRERGLEPIQSKSETIEIQNDDDDESSPKKLREKDLAKQRLKRAREIMNEMYGEENKDDK